jgi:hypothetical protein
MVGMSSTEPVENLLGGPAPTYLPDEHAAARAALTEGQSPAHVAAAYPASSLVWAVLAEQTLDGGDDVVHAVTAYAQARTGYHRGLDALRRAGWRGQGPIPADHLPNQGFLRSLLALSRAADRIGEGAEADRCATFLVDAGTSVGEVRSLT